MLELVFRLRYLKTSQIRKKKTITTTTKLRQLLAPKVTIHSSNMQSILVIDQTHYPKCSCHAFSSKMLLLFVFKTNHPDKESVINNDT